MRRDAELNLDRILQAAQDVFAEGGFEASMEQVASRAGVGVGTLYRHFPQKESLVAAVMTMAGERSKQLALDVLAECPPEDGIFEFMRRCLQSPPNLRALVSRAPCLEQTHRTVLAMVAPAVERLLANAKEAGAVRPEVTFSDVAVLLMSVRSVADRCGGVGSQQAERHLRLLMDGLRQTDSRLPYRPLTRAQLHELLIRQ
jgi:AcrR family transcriptional regulator